jgi:hypothetical protein
MNDENSNSNYNWIAPAVTAVGLASNQLIQGGRNKKAREYGREMAEYSFNKNVEMWNMQNEYNSPSAQIKRYRDAGLNPRLMYGDGGGASSGQATQLPKYQTPNAQAQHTPLSTTEMIQTFQNLRMNAEQVKFTKEQTRALELQNNLKEHILPVEKAQATVDLNTKLLGQEIKVRELTEKQLSVIYKQYENDFARKGIKMGEGWKVKAVIAVAEELGIDISDVLNLPKHGIDELIKDSYIWHHNENETSEFKPNKK